MRPQLLDRFGLAVAVRTPVDPGERAAAVRRRLEFDASPSGVASSFGADEAELARRLSSSRAAAVPDELLEAVSALCASVGAEGLRADLTICRAAAALAGWEERSKAEPEDVRRVAALALAHRARRQPFDPVGADEERLKEALDEHVGGSTNGGADEGGSSDGGPTTGVPTRAGPPTGVPTTAGRGRRRTLHRSRPAQPGSPRSARPGLAAVRGPLADGGVRRGRPAASSGTAPRARVARWRSARPSAGPRRGWRCRAHLLRARRSSRWGICGRRSGSTGPPTWW